MNAYNQKTINANSNQNPEKQSLQFILSSIVELILIIALGLVLFGVTPITPLVAQPILIVYVTIKFCQK